MIKQKNEKKLNKGNILLLSLFMVAFIVSIIGLMYSYNKRIFLLNRQEKINSTTIKEKINIIYRDLYFVKKLDQDDDNIKSIAGNTTAPTIPTNTTTITWQSESAESLEIRSVSLTPEKCNISTNKGNYEININVDWESDRQNSFNELKQKCEKATKGWIKEIIIKEIIKNDNSPFTEENDKIILNTSYNHIEIIPLPPTSQGEERQRKWKGEYLLKINKLDGITISLIFKVSFEYELNVSYTVVADSTATTTRDPIVRQVQRENENGEIITYTETVGYNNTATLTTKFTVSKESSATLKEIDIKREFL